MRSLRLLPIAYGNANDDQNLVTLLIYIALPRVFFSLETEIEAHNEGKVFTNTSRAIKGEFVALKACTDNEACSIIAQLLASSIVHYTAVK